MKKLTLSALAVVAVAGTSFAGPCPIVSKEFKQPCTTPCFRDQEVQLDLFYSYNAAQSQDNVVTRDSFTRGPLTLPVAGGVLPGDISLINNAPVFPAGSTVLRNRSTKIEIPPYFRDGSGGGIGMNYFFARYFGIGVEGNWWEGTQTGFSGQYTARDVVTLPAGTVVDRAALAVAANNARTEAVVSADGTQVFLKRQVRFGGVDRNTASQLTGSLILRYPFEGPICWAPYIFGGGGGIFGDKSVGFGHLGLGVEFRVTPYMGFFTDWRWEFTGGKNGDNDFRDDSNIRELARTVGLHSLNNFDNKSRNDVNMTRVGIRFVF